MANSKIDQFFLNLFWWCFTPYYVASNGIRKPDTKIYGMKLNVGVGAGIHETRPLDADISIDILLPKTKVKNFIRASAQTLPFRDRVFSVSYAHNVLEHLPDPWKALSEILRVSDRIDVVQDRLWSFDSYDTDEHLWLQLPNLRFIPYPRTSLGILFSRWIRRIKEQFLKIWEPIHFTIWIPTFKKLILQPHYHIIVRRKNEIHRES